ncbi:hypothetical protein XA68_14922 [Ophiocordyceps unilateralis]|uniref:Uncharacterized protein n=1 Tax=Ophiocordyceps unilateralis TaxID=268505 RepID=A0A2A9PT99_OPHUN|nr:hypothetical protein XA68_14922 [Ophiocordyceps unilateralis]
MRGERPWLRAHEQASDQGLGVSRESPESRESPDNLQRVWGSPRHGRRPLNPGGAGRPKQRLALPSPDGDDDKKRGGLCAETAFWWETLTVGAWGGCDNYQFQEVPLVDVWRQGYGVVVAVQERHHTCSDTDDGPGGIKTPSARNECPLVAEENGCQFPVVYGVFRG